MFSFIWTLSQKLFTVVQPVLPDSGAHRYFAQILWQIKPNSGDILIAVP
jgi:hypothetical protein